MTRKPSPEAGACRSRGCARTPDEIRRDRERLLVSEGRLLARAINRFPDAVVPVDENTREMFIRTSAATMKRALGDSVRNGPPLDAITMGAAVAIVTDPEVVGVVRRHRLGRCNLPQ